MPLTREDFDLVLVVQICAAVLAVLGAVYEMQRINNESTRRWWVRPCNQLRLESGFFERQFWQMIVHDPEEFKRWCRLTPDQFIRIAELLRPELEKKSLREPLSVEERLAITLEHLAHNSTPASIGLKFARGRSTVSEVIPETCRAIKKVLQPLYVMPPQTQREWKKISHDFYANWQLPLCLGCVDGKHVEIKRPKHSGSLFFNYKKTYSVHLMAVCDSNYKFTMVDIGAFGSNSDSSVFHESEFGKAIYKNEVNTPKEDFLPNTTIKHRYFFAGDNGFPLTPNIMTPFCKRNRDYNDPEHHLFNYRLTRGRRCIENAFGILAAMWLVYQSTMRWTPEIVEDVVWATICLHNFLRTETLREEQMDVAEPELNDNEPKSFFKLDVEPQMSKTQSYRVAVALREQLMSWFLSEAGEVDFQYNIFNLEEAQTMGDEVLRAMNVNLPPY